MTPVPTSRQPLRLGSESDRRLKTGTSSKTLALETREGRDRRWRGVRLQTGPRVRGRRRWQTQVGSSWRRHHCGQPGPFWRVAKSDPRCAYTQSKSHQSCVDVKRRNAFIGFVIRGCGFVLQSHTQSGQMGDLADNDGNNGAGDYSGKGDANSCNGKVGIHMYRLAEKRKRELGGRARASLRRKVKQVAPLLIMQSRRRLAASRPSWRPCWPCSARAAS